MGTVNRYIVWFFYNQRGSSTVQHILSCELPEGLGITDVAQGFWIDDADSMKTWKARYATTGGSMWVPPGRITGITRLQSGDHLD